MCIWASPENLSKFCGVACASAPRSWSFFFLNIGESLGTRIVNLKIRKSWHELNEGAGRVRYMIIVVLRGVWQRQPAACGKCLPRRLPSPPAPLPAAPLLPFCAVGVCVLQGAGPRQCSGLVQCVWNETVTGKCQKCDALLCFPCQPSQWFLAESAKSSLDKIVFAVFSGKPNKKSSRWPTWRQCWLMSAIWWPWKKVNRLQRREQARRSFCQTPGTYVAAVSCPLVLIAGVGEPGIPGEAALAGRREAQLVGGPAYFFFF